MGWVMDFKKILVAVDASENSARALAYVAEMVGGSKGFRVELLHITRLPDKDLFQDEKSWDEQRLKQEQKAQEFLKEARAVLESKGVDPGAVSERGFCIMGHSIAENILEIQEEGGFGTVVVGRRGMSKAEEFLFGSVSSKIVQYAKHCAVWVVA